MTNRQLRTVTKWRFLDETWTLDKTKKFLVSQDGTRMSVLHFSKTWRNAIPVETEGVPVELWNTWKKNYSHLSKEEFLHTKRGHTVSKDWGSKF